MKERLLKAFQREQIVTIIYLAKDGEITKRRIRITKINDNSIQAFCFLKHAKRTFKINNVLALAPVHYRERDVI